LANIFIWRKRSDTIFWRLIRHPRGPEKIGTEGFERFTDDFVREADGGLLFGDDLNNDGRLGMKNVVLLTIDTLRKDVFECYGGTKKLTPFMDTLRKQSLLFTKAQAVGSYTQASFPGILASSYYLDYPDHGKGKVLSPKRMLISEVLRKNGIATAAFHSNAYLCEVFGWNRGWDRFYDAMDVDITDETPYLRGDGINRLVDAWLSGRAAEKPFFLWAHYMDVHEPYVPPRPYIDRVDASIRLSVPEMMALFTDVLLKRDVSNPQNVEILRKLYDAHVVEADDYVKEFFALLERRGVLKDSVVIVTSDHGDEFNEHGGLSHDGKVFSELVDVPLFFVDPSGTLSGVCARPVSNADLPPTILSLFGLPPHEAFQGRSLTPLSALDERVCYGEVIGKCGRQKETDKPVFYCRDGDLRLSFYEEENAWRLFDLREDPEERRNIVDSSPEAGRLKSLLKARMERSREHA
jgi:arylsulfatase